MKNLRKFSQEQRLFIEAKALLETVKGSMEREVEARVGELGINAWSTNEEEVKKCVDVEMEIEEKYHFDEIRRGYNKAFWELLRWAILEVRKKYPVKAKELRLLLDPENKMFVHTRQEKIADTLLSLST